MNNVAWLETVEINGYVPENFAPFGKGRFSPECRALLQVSENDVTVRITDGLLRPIKKCTHRVWSPNSQGRCPKGYMRRPGNKPKNFEKFQFVVHGKGLAMNGGVLIGFLATKRKI